MTHVPAAARQDVATVPAVDRGAAVCTGGILGDGLARVGVHEGQAVRGPIDALLQ
jgi:hypothetical protein